MSPPTSATGARYYALDGTLYAEEVLPLENPVLTAARSTGVVYDAGGQSLFVFQNGREVSDLSLEDGIDLLSVRPNDSGWLAVTAQQSGYKGAVTVYNASHQPVFQISLSSTFVVDAALSPDCKTVAVVTMDQEGGHFNSRLLFYPVDQTEPSAQVELGDQVVAGQPIALVQQAEGQEEAYLHFELRAGGEAFNPCFYLD